MVVIRYNYVFFIDASSIATIQADLQSAIRSLGSRYSQATFEGAIRFLANEAGVNWLIIFDNADDPTVTLPKFFPPCPYGTIIITTRNPDLCQLAPDCNLQLIRMNDPEGVHVILRAAHYSIPVTEKDSIEAAAICRMLGGLPLALVQAGNYCYTTSTSLGQYQILFEKHRAALMSRPTAPHLDLYSRSAYAALDLSYTRLNETERGFLHILALFHPSSISLEIFRVAASRHFATHFASLPRGDLDSIMQRLEGILIPDGAWNDLYINDLVHSLRTYSLISIARSGDVRSITIHPLIRSWAQDILSAAQYNQYFCMVVCILCGCSRYEDFSVLRHLPAHILNIIECAPEINVIDLVTFGDILRRAGLRSEAKKVLMRADDTCRASLDQENRDRLLTSSRLARCLLEDEPIKAEVMLREAIEVQKKVLGDEDEDTLFSCRTLSYALWYQDKNEESENVLRALLKLEERVLGKEHTYTLTTRSELALVLNRQNKSAEAEDVLSNLLLVVERVLGKDDPSTLTTAYNLATTLMSQQNWGAAATVLKDLNPRQTLVFGKEHHKTKRALDRLSRCLEEQAKVTSLVDSTIVILT